MSCVLTDRTTEQPVKPEDTRTGWIAGEYDVSPSLDRTSATNWNFARDAAIARAREGLLDRFACEGRCETEGHFCVLDVQIVANRTGRIVRRMVDNHPDSFPYKNGELKSEHIYLTYEVQAEAACRCEAPPRAPAAPAGKVEHYGPPPGAPPPAPGGYLELKPKLSLGYPLGIDLKYKW